MGIADVTKKAAGVALAAPKKAAVGYFRGLTYPFRGLRLVYFEHPSLIRIWIFPILITLVILAFVTKGVWDYHDAFVSLFWSEPTGEDFWASVGRFFHGFVEVLAALLLFVIGLLVVYFVTSVVAAPFNDALSEEVERIQTGREGPPLSLRAIARDSVRTVGLEIVKLTLWAAVMGPLFLASLLLPVVGQILYTIIGFLFTAMYWSIDYVDWPASRRNRGISYRFSMATTHFLPMLGYGTGVWIFLFVPFLNLLFMPAAVAGGTLLFLDLEGNPHDDDAQGESTQNGLVQAPSP